MPCTRTELEARERLTLASFAQFSADSRGREHAEHPPEFRTDFQRDRDRVIHSRAFRRLEYKTQVFLNGTGDHLRTRLTHTMEVAGISRNIARALRLNEDLAETIALAHDLGHSPFGHTGEKILDRLMKGQGGFEHNSQSVRVVTVLEQKYPSYPGLNLTWETLEGLSKHQTAYDHPRAPRTGPAYKQTSLEAQVANLADEIAYYSHDLDDGLESGLLSESQLRRDNRLWGQAHRAVLKLHRPLPDECRRSFIIRCLIDEHVRDVVTTSEKRIQAAGVKSAEAVRRSRSPLIQYSALRRKLNLELRAYLYKNLYFNPEVRRPNEAAARMLVGLFGYYTGHPEELGEVTRKRVREQGLPRAVCDYLAGMTDRYAIQEYQRHFGPSTL